ncbi:hypothetical protein A9996_18720 [Gelidibacter algens]|nr:hypothetical protein A9996_18720 [Gelidibacter algens]
MVTFQSLAQKKIEFVYPNKVFDTITAGNQINESGTATINGRALLDGKRVGYYVKISLFPLNEYFMEYLELEKQFGLKGKMRASLSPLALSYRLITISRDAETFTFTNLKPGKYYIESYVTKVKEKRGAHYVGQESTTFEGSYISGPPIFQEYTYNKFKQHHLAGMVEIDIEGETVQVTIQN